MDKYKQLWLPDLGLVTSTFRQLRVNEAFTKRITKAQLVYKVKRPSTAVYKVKNNSRKKCGRS